MPSQLVRKRYQGGAVQLDGLIRKTGQLSMQAGQFNVCYVAWLIPALRQISPTGIPASPCLMMNAFCASVNFDVRIGFAPPSQVPDYRKLQAETIQFSGSRAP